VSPVLVWAAIASFLPQTLGLAYAVGGVAAFIAARGKAFEVPVEGEWGRFGRHGFGLEEILQGIPRVERLLIDLNQSPSTIFNRYIAYTLLRERTIHFHPGCAASGTVKAPFSWIPILPISPQGHLAYSLTGGASDGSSIRYTCDARGLVVGAWNVKLQRVD
jgi:hypothetical protein